MSIESMAADVAGRLREWDFVHVHGHHDADGIAAAAIIGHALRREGIGFRLRFHPRITSASIEGEDHVVLCDFGAALEDLPEDTVVIDHHVPHFGGEWQVNPRLAGIDGDRDLCAAGAAYLVARALCDSRDLAGLVIPAIIGDRQQCAGTNQEIVRDGIAHGYVSPEQGVRLPGRTRTEQFHMAIHPYLDGLSGDQDAVAALISQSTAGGTEDPALLLSLAVIRSSPVTRAEALCAIFGDTYRLGREVIEDAHTLFALTDACGKAGAAGVAASLCLRSPDFLEEAWETAYAFRLRVIEGVREARPLESGDGFYETGDAGVAGDIADALAYDTGHGDVVVIFAPTNGTCAVSARVAPGSPVDLEEVMREGAAACGGTGGGHHSRAGAVIPARNREAMERHLAEALP